jgi:hypothetical protein
MLHFAPFFRLHGFGAFVPPFLETIGHFPSCNDLVCYCQISGGFMSLLKIPAFVVCVTIQMCHYQIHSCLGPCIGDNWLFGFES